MPVYRDYEIRININELIEARIPVCDALHPDHCLREEQVDEIAHHLRTHMTLDSIYSQVDHAIWDYCEKFEVENPNGDDPRPHYGEISPPPGWEAELNRREKNMKEFEMVTLKGGSWEIQVPRRKNDTKVD